jgi:hypothetical protein
MKNAATASLIKAGMDGNGRFRSPGDALSKIGNVLSLQGMEWGEVIQSFPLKQPSGNMSIRLAITNPADPFSPTDISNSVLAFQWYQLESGQYEVVAYLS